MSTYFIDYQGFYIGKQQIIKELCIMNANDVFNPYHNVFLSDIEFENLVKEDIKTNQYLTNSFHKLTWQEGAVFFCPMCILKTFKVDFDHSTFYSFKDKMPTIKRYFPAMRLIAYSKNLTQLRIPPENITCPWREHGKHCSYKQCLSLFVDYCKV